MQELQVAQKVEQMIEYGYVAVRHFPKSERHVLSAELRGSMWRLLRLVVVCGKRYHKKTTLTELDTELELLRRKVRLAKDLKFLPFRQYEIWSRQLDEIGRMIGGWIKNARKG